MRLEYEVGQEQQNSVLYLAQGAIAGGTPICV